TIAVQVFLPKTYTISDAEAGMAEDQHECANASGIVVAVRISLWISIARPYDLLQLLVGEHLHPLGGLACLRCFYCCSRIALHPNPRCGRTRRTLVVRSRFFCAVIAESGHSARNCLT